MAEPVINHHPIQDTDSIAAWYSVKDGVPIKYVCTTGYGEETRARDIFYRDTPHPEFGNRYFHIFYELGYAWIGDADIVEDQVFTMIEGPDGLEYSQHRYDFREVGAGYIDGGRAYHRSAATAVAYVFVVRDGEFIRGAESS